MGPRAPQPRLGSPAVECPGTADQVTPPRSSTATKRSQSATWRAAPLYRSGAAPAAEASCFTTRSTPPLHPCSGILRHVSGSAQARTAGAPLAVGAVADTKTGNYIPYVRYVRRGAGKPVKLSAPLHALWLRISAEIGRLYSQAG